MASGALAQVAAPLQVPPIERATPPVEPQFVKPRPAAPSTITPSADDRQVNIDDVVVEGVTAYPDGAFRSLYAPLVGTATMAQVSEVLQRIQLRYNQDGYILTNVRGSIEPAEGKSRLVIRVVEGFISDVKLEGDIGPAGVRVYRYLANLMKIRPVRVSDLERYLLLAEDIPGVGVRAVLRPATGEPGAVQMIAQVSHKAYGGYTSYDNRGPEFSGPNDFLIDGTLQSLTSLGESTDVQFFNTLSGEQFFGQVAEQVLLGSEGLRLRGYFGLGNSRPGGVLAPTGYNGDLLVAGVGLAYPLIRSRPLSLKLLGDLDFYESSIQLAGPGGDSVPQSNSRLRVVRTGAQLNSQDALFGAALPGANLAIARLHHGLIGLGSSSNDSALPARPGNRIDFTKLTAEISRLQDLGKLGDVGTAVQVTVAGQYTNDILPPSEKFYLGGNRFGRGFFSGDITGDRALGASVEFQVNAALPSPSSYLGEGNRLATQFYVFFDEGNSYDLAPGDVDRQLQSTGLGVRVNLTEAVSTELEGVRRFTRKPTGENVAPEKTYAVFGRIVSRF